MVGSTTNTAAYAGNASTSTAYVIPFRYDAPGWIHVTLTSPAGVTVDLVAGEDYTLAGDGASASGTLTTTLAYSSDYTLHLWREAPGLQALDLVANTPLPANSLEGALDRAAMAAEDSTRPRHFWSLVALVARIESTLAALNPFTWGSIVDKPTTFAPSDHDQGWDTITGKPTTFSPSSHSHAQSEITDLATDLGLLAPKDSPEFTGAPTAPTAAPNTNSTQLATTEFVKSSEQTLLGLAHDDAVGSCGIKRRADIEYNGTNGLSIGQNKILYYTESEGSGAVEYLTFSLSVALVDGQEYEFFSSRDITSVDVGCPFGSSIVGEVLSSVVANTLYRWICIDDTTGAQVFLRTK